jgi:transcriptional regulator with XRE-family HTH domain
MDLVLKLRELRRLRGLSQKAAALASGVGEKTLSSFETGERITSIKLGQLLAILRAYDTTLSEFVGSKVETAIFAEFERLTPRETEIIRGLRRLPDSPKVRVEEKFLAMIEVIEVADGPRLHAVR